MSSEDSSLGSWGPDFKSKSKNNSELLHCKKHSLGTVVLGGCGEPRSADHTWVDAFLILSEDRRPETAETRARCTPAQERPYWIEFMNRIVRDHRVFPGHARQKIPIKTAKLNQKLDPPSFDSAMECIACTARMPLPYPRFN